jgi:glycosyltransferase involved in cell wall biosynthesis
MARIALVHDIAGVAAVQAEILRGAGHDVDQIPLPDLGASWRWPVKALALPLRLVAFVPVARRLRTGRYDVIHIHFLSQGVVGVMARRSFFVQAHGSDLHLNLGHVVYRPVTRAVVDRARAVFYVTPNLREYLEPYRSTLVYLPNPVAIPPDSPAPSAINEILVFTRLHPVKGVDAIFPAVERLSTMARVTAIENGPLAAEYAGRYGRWVRFVQPIPHDEIADFLGGFDVVIGQMRQGVLGLMEIEAMASGRAVIASVDQRLYAEDPPPVIPASSPDDVVEAVRTLRDDPAQLADLAKKGREWVRRNHSYERHLEVLESAYFGERARNVTT